MLLSYAERMLNEQIANSTAARARLTDLEGKRFALVIRGSDFRVLATAEGGSLALDTSPDAESDVELTAGVIDLLRLARSASLTDLRNVGAQLNGDIRVAEAFSDLFRLAMPEPEAMLAEWVGDMPAHAAGQAARHIGSWSIKAGRAFEQNMAEYLQEESPTLIPPPLARAFSADVDRIRDDVDRAERRIARLEKKLAGKAG